MYDILKLIIYNSLNIQVNISETFIFNNLEILSFLKILELRNIRTSFLIL